MSEEISEIDRGIGINVLVSINYSLEVFVLTVGVCIHVGTWNQNFLV